MNQPDPAAMPLRSRADTRWTRAKIQAFLGVLARTGNVSDAARAVGMSRQSAYRLRARLGSGFGEVWDEGLGVALTIRREQGDRCNLRGDTCPQQGDTCHPHGDTADAQGDTCNLQGDTFWPQSDTSGPPR